jgi:hypothetical protein
MNHDRLVFLRENLQKSVSSRGRPAGGARWRLFRLLAELSRLPAL